jgi:hypothetical protein
MELKFEERVTPRVLMEALRLVPEEELDLPLTVQFRPTDTDGTDEKPGLITNLYPFPCRTPEAEFRDGRLQPVVWTLGVAEGDTIEVIEECGREFGSFLKDIQDRD